MKKIETTRQFDKDLKVIGSAGGILGKVSAGYYRSPENISQPRIRSAGLPFAIGALQP